MLPLLLLLHRRPTAGRTREPPLGLEVGKIVEKTSCPTVCVSGYAAHGRGCLYITALCVTARILLELCLPADSVTKIYLSQGMSCSAQPLCGYPEQSRDELRLPHRISDIQSFDLSLSHHMRCFNGSVSKTVSRL